MADSESRPNETNTQLVGAAGGIRDRARLLQMRMKTGGGPAGGPIRSAEPPSLIAASAASGPRPLSSPQQRLWLLQRMAPASPAYNIPLSLRLTGSLDVAVLQRVLSEIVRRHEILRTTFPLCGEHPLQVVAPPNPVTLPVDDLEAIPTDQREARVEQIRQAEWQRPFDLENGSVLRTRLVRLAGQEHVLVLTLHHIAGDGGSMGVLSHELGVLYRAFAAQLPSPLPELSIQFGDYARWQQDAASRPGGEPHLNWWKQTLAGAPTLISLPIGRGRPPVQGWRGGNVAVPIENALAERLVAFGRSNGATLFQAGLAVFHALVHRYTGQADFLVGTPVANRPSEELLPMVGFFANTIVLRADCRGQPTFRELLIRTRDAVGDALDHAETPFERVVEQLRPERSAAHNPVFQMAFMIENARPAIRDAGGVTFTDEPVVHHVAKWDLSVTFRAAKAGSRVNFQYDAELFERDAIARLAGHFVTMLEGVLAAPDAPIASCPLLSKSEERQLASWNNTSVSIPRSSGVHELFERQAASTPEAVALVLDAEHITYHELSERARSLACRLRREGVEAGAFVGVHLDRSIELVVAILAVLQTGAAYVPLDTLYPPGRIRLMVEDAGLKVVLSRGGLPEEAVPVGTRLLNPGSREPIPSDPAETAAWSPARVGGDAPAYVIYTSGSTGRPKGVVVPHRGIVRLVFGQQYAAFGPGERHALLASPAFDASTFELWSPLLRGGTCVIFPDRWPDFARLEEVIRGQGITCLWLTAGLFNQIIDERPGVLGSVHQVLTGGEALSVPHVRRALKLLPHLRLTNGYGPTECTTFACTYPIPPDGDWPGTSVPIGRPIANTVCRILDSAGQPVPVGVPGELHLGGDGLALGYLNRPELTAERFVPDAAGEAGARLYRTGDRCQWLEDGNIAFLGRFDDQVKLRGFRIEPGEIEHALTQLADVQRASVIVREDSPGVRQLVAYVVLRPAGALDHRQLRERLKASLPDHMIPTAFVPLAELPLTANGKVDRAALPAPGTTSFGVSRRAPPATPTEQWLAHLWKELLGREDVSREDDFFALGGHSLMAMRLTARVLQERGRQLPLVDIFGSPTLRALAARIDAAPLSADLALQRADRSSALLLSSHERRLWMSHQFLARPETYNVGWGARLSGPFDVSRFQQALQTLVRRHEILRTAYAPGEGEPVRRISAELEVPFSFAESAAGVGDSRPLEEWVQEQLARPFDLEAAPLLRMHVLRFGDEKHIVLLVIHHCIADEWSLQVLGEELAALYASGGDAAGAGLAPVIWHYADYAAWQRNALAGQAMAAHRAWWAGRLEHVPSPLELPFDHARPGEMRGTGDRVDFAIEAETAEAMGQVADQTGATSFMAWLGVFAAFLSRLSGAEDLVVGTPVADRSRPEFQRMPGFFLNTVPIRLCVPGSGTIEQLLRSVRSEVLEAFEHAALPLDEILVAQGRARSAGATALFDVMFVLHDQPRIAWSLPGTTAGALPAATNTAKAALTLFLQHGEDGGWRANLEYSDELFAGSTVARLVGLFQEFARSVAREPARAIGDVSLLTEAQRRQLVLDFGRGPVRPDDGTSVAALFHAQVASRPEAIAVVAGGERVSYAALASRANRLAAALAAAGVVPGDRVALHLERSAALIAAEIAVLQVGAAYVPLDPEYPASRQHFILEDSRVKLVLSSGPMAPAARPMKLPVLQLDEGGVASTGNLSVPPAQPGGEAAAYVMYTSGSTGQPKGVVIPHRGIVRLVCAQDYFTLGPDDRVLFLSSPSFDASTFEVWAPLLRGATCVVHPPRWPDLEDLEELVRAEGVTCAWLTCGLFNQIVDDRPGLLGLLRHVLTGGEALSVRHVRRALELAPALTLTNGYGPTECTTFACTYAIPGSGAWGADSVPIGRPIAETTARVVDARGHLVPVGVAGELWLGGAGVALGYLNRPELTGERFIPDEVGGDSTARLYRTGDRVRWLPDGNLEFLGRLDNQVKLRGFRIEPGEIEAELGRHPAVERSAVVVRPTGTGDRMLHAFAVLHARNVVQPAELRRWLADRLPPYMVPAQCTVVEVLPLNANGKIDRAALIAAHPLGLPEPASLPPRTSTEQVLAEIWQRVLKRERIGVDENFFEIGGHSLAALRLVQEIRRALDRPLTIAGLFAAPTIAGLARALDSAAEAGRTLPAGRGLRGSGPGAVLFHMPGLGGIGFLPPAVVRCIERDRPFYDGLLHRGLDERAAPRARVEAIAEDMIDQIRQVQPSGPYCFTGYCFGGLVAYEVARRLTAAGQPVTGVVMWDSVPSTCWQWRPWREVVRRFGQRWSSMSAGERARFLLSPARRLARRVRNLPAEVRAQAQSAPEEVTARGRLLMAAEYRAIRAYQPGAYRGRVLLLRSKRVEESWITRRRRPLDGWEDLAVGPLEVAEHACEHLAILEEPHLSQAGERMAAFLRAGDAAPAG